MLATTSSTSALPPTQVTATRSRSGLQRREQQRAGVVDAGVDVEDHAAPYGGPPGVGEVGGLASGPMGRTLPTARLAGLTAVVALAVGACTSAGTPPAPTSTSGTTASSSSSSTTASPTSSSTRPSSSTTTRPPTASTPASCATRVAAGLTVPQKVGQLLMVGLFPGDTASVEPSITSLHLGGLVYLGGWNGSGTVAATSQRVQSLTGPQGTGGIRLMVAADQEGGQVLQLRPPGFTSVPSAVTMGSQGASATTSYGALVGRELAAAGVNVDLAPVADTVPASLGTGNGPIGRYDRQFGSDPTTVAGEVQAFVTGLRSAGVVATVKHFPGLGRITANTDTSSTGITDTQTTATDPYLQPFAAGVKAGAQLVMVSSATYTRIDASQPAVFSSAVVTDLLRGRLGYGGVVVTDDVGVAKAVAAVPAGDRAVRFVDAGGDIVLSASLPAAQQMAASLQARYASDASFAAKVDASVGRVLALKQGMGLLPCG